jgi:hypothetical protein
MKTCLLVIIASVITFQATAAEPVNPLEALDNLILGADPSPAPLSITANYRAHDSKRFLAFRVTNIGKTPIDANSLNQPWRSPGVFLAVAALTTEGHRLQNKYPDPVLIDSILTNSNALDTYPIPKLLPGDSMEGEYDLDNKLVFPTPLPKDVILMWAYLVPHDIQASPKSPPTRYWKFSGVVAIPVDLSAPNPLSNSLPKTKNSEKPK